MTTILSRERLWHPLTATAGIAVVAVSGIVLHSADLAAGVLLCWMVIGAASGFATSGST